MKSGFELSFHIHTVFQPICQLSNLLLNSKLKSPSMNVLGVVYLISCRGCDSVYIGYTAGTRLKKHRWSFEKCDMHSKIVIHSRNTDYILSLDNIKILYSECKYYEARIFLECWHTDTQSNSINEACAVAFEYSILL